MEQKPIGDIQRTQMESLRSVQHNELDGEKVVDDLLAWRDMWLGRCACGVSIQRGAHVWLQRGDGLLQLPAVTRMPGAVGAAGVR